MSNNDAYAVGAGPVTGRIYAGRVDETGTEWVEKTDVTDQAIAAVLEHILHVHGSEVTLRGRRLVANVTIEKS